MQYNATNNCRVKHIMVQLQEQTDEQSEAYKAGYINICEIGKERIRRAGKEIKEKSPLITQNLDTGFRVFKLDESNMNDVWYSADEYSQGKHIYFVAETKGSMNSMQLRMVEESKIHCAREHFKAISGGNVDYDVVDSYQSLLDRVMK